MAKYEFILIKQDGVLADVVVTEHYGTREEGEEPDEYYVPTKFFNLKEVPGAYGGTRKVHDGLKDGVNVEWGTRKDYNLFVDNRPDPEWIDQAGKLVKRGSRVAVAFALGRGAEIRIGRVIGFARTLTGQGMSNFRDIDGREQIEVEWESDNRAWGGSPDKSKIFAGLKRYVVID